MILYDKFMNNDAEMCSNNTLMNPHNTVPNYYLKTSSLKKSTIQKFIIRHSWLTLHTSLLRMCSEWFPYRCSVCNSWITLHIYYLQKETALDYQRYYENIFLTLLILFDR